MSRSRPGSSSPRWRGSASRRSGARAAATARGSSARKWSRALGSSTETRARSGICGSPSDEHPLAIQIFGSDPRIDGRGGADGRRRRRGHRRHELRLSGKEGHEDRRRAPICSRIPELACRITAAVASAVDVPVTVKMRRGVEDGSRRALELAPETRRCRRGGADAPSALGEADVHGLRRPHAYGRARRARRRSRHRLGRRHVAGEGRRPCSLRRAQPR